MHGLTRAESPVPPSWPWLCRDPRSTPLQCNPVDVLTRPSNVRRFFRRAGAGGYGLVKKATHKETGLSTAIKILKLPDLGKPSSNTRGGKKVLLGAPCQMQYCTGRLTCLAPRRIRKRLAGERVRCFTAGERGASPWRPISRTMILSMCVPFLEDMHVGGVCMSHQCHTEIVKLTLTGRASCKRLVKAPSVRA